MTLSLECVLGGREGKLLIISVVKDKMIRFCDLSPEDCCFVAVKLLFFRIALRLHVVFFISFFGKREI